MKDVMVDLETLGTKPGSVILSIGAVAFDETGLGEQFYRVISISSSLQAGLKEDADTKLWWSKQAPEARTVLDQATDLRIAVPLVVALTEFAQWLGSVAPLKDIKVWGNGSDFDNMMLAAAYDAVQMSLPWRFYNNRCYRTLKNLLPAITFERSGVHHNALDDAMTQAAYAVVLFGAIERGKALDAKHNPWPLKPIEGKSQNSNLG